MRTSSLFRNAKNKIMKYTPAQILVRDATSNEEMPPREDLMIDIAALTFNSLILDQMIIILMKRLNDDCKNWRHIHKSLTVFEFLIINGSDSVYKFVKNNRHFFESLKAFSHFKDSYDCGRIIRQLAIKIVDLINDDRKLEKAREESRMTVEAVKNKWTNEGVSMVRQMGTERYEGIVGSNDNLSTWNSSSMDRDRPPSKVMLSDDIKRAMPADQDDEKYQLQMALRLSQEESARKVNALNDRIMDKAWLLFNMNNRDRQ
ncbi:Epsin-3 [Thelohanellus kitauei]|uniref:Epsin-3 n=1 Tax=Thelohanellus kitauei TaxID=669202 RepID=A0A0C2N1M9_THEKT|nr:Epsin-3 [Thelohanellus kitauei]